MSAIMFDNKVYNREVTFCKVYSSDSKEKLEKLFLKNRISYFIEWQDKSFWERMLSSDGNKEKAVYVIRINEEDVARAKELIQGIDSIKLRKEENHE